MSPIVNDRILIVNADDFGQSIGINNGILRAYREGILTSASLMVRAPASEDAVNRAGNIAIGLHLDLGEWAFRDGEWVARYERVSLDDPPAVEAEVRCQVDEFRRLTGRAPAHLDSHQHVHLQEPVRSIAKRLAHHLSVPLRRCTPEIRYCGQFYGQTGDGKPCADEITVDALLKLLDELPHGVTELACHPGEDHELNSTYREERFQETRVLCDPRVREVIRAKSIVLCAYPDLATYAQNGS